MRALIFLMASLIAGAQPRIGPATYWPMVVDETSTSALALTAAGTWGSIGFQATASRTLSEIHVSIASVSGTLATADLRLALYSDSAGKPGTLIEERDSAGAPAAGWNSITGYTSAVTAGTTYWIVYRNMDATPASNNFTITRRTTSISGLGNPNSATAGTQGAWMAASSTDGGSAWTRASGIVPIVLVWSDGTKEGFPIISSETTTCQIYQTRECGIHFRTGAAGVRLSGAAAIMNRNASPTGSARYRIYEGTGNVRTLLATSFVSANVTSSTVSHTAMWFPAPVVLKPLTWYTLVLSETTQSDTASNRFNLSAYNLRSDHAALFGPGLSAAPIMSLSTDGGATWTDTANAYPHIAGILDATRPVVITSGGFAQ